LSGVDDRGVRTDIRIVLADDDPLAAAFVRQLLAASGDLRVVATAAPLADLHQLLEAERPDLLLTEVSLGGESVLPDLPRIVSDLHAVVMTTEMDMRTVLEAVAAGASGYLLKDQAFAGLADGLRACAAGRQVLDERLIGVILDGYRDLAAGIVPSGKQERESSISDRAMAVLELMAAGLRNREIAERLGLSEHTVKVYVGQVFAYLGVSDRTSAVMQALRRGLVPPPVRDLRPAR
jgi:DNA-binding NarL/FixJ family response regulator